MPATPRVTATAVATRRALRPSELEKSELWMSVVKGRAVKDSA
jgi:hypothetical protein